MFDFVRQQVAGAVAAVSRVIFSDTKTSVAVRTGAAFVIGVSVGLYVG